jgi:integrase
MNKANFTAERVARFRCELEKQQTIFWDGKTPGLGLRVTAANAKSYIFETRLRGRTIRLTIGDVRTWAISKAQAEATRLKTLTDQGIDPRQQRVEQQARAEALETEERRKSVTLREAWSEYIKAREHKWGRWSLRDNQNVMLPERNSGDADKPKTLKAGPLASLASLKLSELTDVAVEEWLRRERDLRPTRVALAFRLLRAFINWTSTRDEFRGIAAPSACGRRMSREHLSKRQPKTDCLQREQLAAWFSQVRKIRNPVISAYLQVLLLTGARREELAGLTWDCVDFQWNVLTIRDKVDGQRSIPLTPYVASLLTALPQQNQYVFSSRIAASGRLQEPRIAHNRALALAGLPALSLHGLRRTFKSLSEWVEVPVGITAQIMGHKPSATAEKHYTVRPVDLLRLWHTKIEAWFLGEADVEPAINKQKAVCG